MMTALKESFQENSESERHAVISAQQLVIALQSEMSENFEVSLKYVLKHATFRSSNIFQLFDTSEKPNHFVANRRRWLESQGSGDARQENGRNEWYDLGYQGAKAKAPPCPNSTLQTPLPQQSSASAREDEDHWEVMEERRRRRIAFENPAKGMLRYLDNCNDVKVGITELQERVEVPAQICISVQQAVQQRFSKYSGKKKENMSC